MWSPGLDNDRLLLPRVPAVYERYQKLRYRPSRVLYYLGCGLRELVPGAFYRNRRRRLLEAAEPYDEEVSSRLRYYVKHQEPIPLADEAVALGRFKQRGHASVYYHDLKQYLRYYEPHLRFAFRFGDITDVAPFPEIVKSRPVSRVEGNGEPGIDNANSLLFKLEKNRHFNFIKDPHRFAEKRKRVVFRCVGAQPHRVRFLERYCDHPLCDVGQIGRSADPRWRVPFLGIGDQIRNQFVLNIEGCDVATSLKWAMSSNSLCLMTRPKYETWFLEGTLEAGRHYVELREDYEDLEEKVEYYSRHVEEAEAIIEQAHAHVRRFQEPAREELLCLLVLDRYFRLTGQLPEGE
jgi:hypothetical protein